MKKKKKYKFQCRQCDTEILFSKEDCWIDRTIEIIKQQPSEDDTWILERLNGIKQCLKGADKE